MLPVGMCKQWYGCFLKISSAKDMINLLNNTSSKSLCSFHKKFVTNNRSHHRYLSTDHDSEIKNQSKLEKLLEDSTVPEESTVEGDTENWTTSPYPKGMFPQIFAHL